MKNTISINSNAVCIGKKSWVTYLFVIFPILLSIIPIGVAQGIGGTGGAVLTFLACIIWWGLFIYSISYCRIFIDSDGIWCRSGILPWNKGYSGVRWRDLDEAVYEPGFTSWLFNAYTIVLTHRYSKQAEIKIPGISNGREVASRINATHSQLINSGELEK